jgi:hypothetical protein
MLTVWTQSTGFNLGVYQEREELDLSLPVVSDPSVSYSVISGKLPAGVRLIDDRLVGIPHEVPRPRTSTFCIRASSNGEISDRVFTMTVAGADSPLITSNAGYLPVGVLPPVNVYPIHPFDDYLTQLYALDNSWINYQIEAIDDDLSTGQQLSFFIGSGDGELPPGLTLSRTGLISGFIQAVLSIKPKEGDGTYDDTYYDTVLYDYGRKPFNGYDTYRYDTAFFDFITPFIAKEKLNRRYEFYVSVTDGDTVSKKKFGIFVVGDDYFRADNTEADFGLFTADVTYLREPIWITPSDLGVYRANNYITLVIETFNAYDTGNIQYDIDSLDNLPPGLEFNPRTGDVYGVVPYQAGLIKSYSWTITATRYGTNHDETSSSRSFSVKIIGEVDSFISWVTDAHIGTIRANRLSTLQIEATTTVPDAEVIYNLISGELPPGLALTPDGKIAGKVRQFPDSIYPGLTTIDGSDFTLDSGETIIDRTYTFTVEASDQYGYAYNTKTFTLSVDAFDDKQYSNIYIRPLVKQSQRQVWNQFIEDNTIFDLDYLYRPLDPNYGVRKDMRVLVYAGIETTTAASYVTAMAMSNETKKLKFGDVKKASAIDKLTGAVLYEVVYITVIDPLEVNGKYIKNTENNYANSITNWRKTIETVGDLERTYLPQWMSSIQPGSLFELDYVLAMPICFCNPGSADDMILNIKHSDFDFKSIDFTVDRYIIDAVTGNNSDKYLAFTKDRTTV